MANKTIYMFPSPFGGRVLKCAGNVSILPFVARFRPLSGFVF